MKTNTFLMTAVLLLLASARLVTGQTLLLDNFTSDTAVNTSLWTNQSPVLNAVLTNYNSEWIAPVLRFGPGGMQMSGVDGENELTGLASVQSFSPPLTLTVTVEGTIAHGNPFELLLVSSNLASRMSLLGNLNKSNDPYYGMWINYTGSGISFLVKGDSFYSQPSTNALYTIQMSVDGTGNGAALMADTNGTILALETGLSVGTGPFYVVLAQREGTPTTVGTKVSVWNCASVVAGAMPPVQIAPAAWQPSTPSGFTMMLQGPIGSNYVIETSADLRLWSALTNIVSTNTPFFFHDSENDTMRFYRAKLESH